MIAYLLNNCNNVQLLSLTRWSNAQQQCVIHWPHVATVTVSGPLIYTNTHTKSISASKDILIHLMFWKALVSYSLWLSLTHSRSSHCVFSTSRWCWQRDCVSTTCSSTSWRPERLVRERFLCRFLKPLWLCISVVLWVVMVPNVLQCQSQTCIIVLRIYRAESEIKLFLNSSLIHRTEESGSRLCVWFCPVNGRREGSSQPDVSLPDCQEHHPPRVRSRWELFELISVCPCLIRCYGPMHSSNAHILSQAGMNLFRLLIVSCVLSQVNSQRSCSKWRPAISPSTSIP